MYKRFANSLIVLVFSHNFLLYQEHYDEEDEDASDDDESDDIVDDVMLEDFLNLEESEEEDEIDEEEEGEGEEPVGIDDFVLDRKAEMRQKVQELCRRKREDLEYRITSRDLSALYDFRIDKFQVIFLFKLMACSSL